MDKTTIFLLTLALVPILIIIVIKVLEEYSIRLYCDGNIPDTKEHLEAVEHFLAGCQFLDGTAVYNPENRDQIKYITCTLQGTTFKWIVRGVNNSYIIPKRSILHKMIEERWKQLHSQRLNKLF